MGAAAWHLRSSSDPALEPPLLARMVEFWFNHFNVYVGKGAVRPFVGHYLVNAIRPHALGRFEDLVFATARHPARLTGLLATLCSAAGAPDGIVAGQAWECEPRASLGRYQRAKTGALFVASTCAGAQAAGADPQGWRGLGE